MQIYGPVHLHGASPINAPHTSRVSSPAAPDASSGPIQDEVQISDAGRRMEEIRGTYVDQVREMADVRQDRVAQIRAQIANGTYETPEKLNLAMERLLDEIA
jgi:negative regulator of flagellin synthesis FlgM